MRPLSAASLDVPAFAHAAAPPPPAKRLTIRFATSYAEMHPVGRALRTVLAGFQRDYPSITIALEETPDSDQQTKVKFGAASDRMPNFSTTGDSTAASASIWWHVPASSPT